MDNAEVLRSRNGSEGGVNSRSTRGISERADWIVRVEEELLKRKSENVRRERQYMFFSVPKPLRDSFEHFYVPDMVSMGPHHFGDPRLRFMESHKVEAMCRMESRIQKIDPERTLKAIVEKEIMGMEKWIRDCYEEEIPYSPVELAWMVTGDACFIYEFIICYCDYVCPVDVKEQLIHAAKYDSIFDSCGRSPTWRKIMFNLVLFENQIPLSILEILVEFGNGSQEAIREKLHKNWLQAVISRNCFCVFYWWMIPPSGKGENPHLLRVFYHAAVGYPSFYENRAYEEPQLAPSFLACLKKRIGYMIAFLMRCLGLRSSDSSNFHVNDEDLPKLPSATVLKQKGVRFQAVAVPVPVPVPVPGPDRLIFSPIQCVGFDEKTSTLRLPKVNVDDFRIALMRNFIALEATNGMYGPFPMTAFALLMNELIDNGEDCKLLSEAGIIANRLGSDEEVANSFNSLTQGMDGWLSPCKSTYNARVGLHKYLRKTYRILLSEFYSTYLSRPWQIAGLIAATLLLLMTVLQVVCLFATCNP